MGSSWCCTSRVCAPTLRARLSVAPKTSEETAAHISQSSWELGKPLQAHHAFHYTLIPPACQAESRARLAFLTAPRQMAVMKGNFHPLQSKTTSEAPSVGARQAAGPGGPCPTSHAPALARSRQRWCRSSADVSGKWSEMPQLPSAPSDAQTALHEQGLLSATLLKEPGFPSLLTGKQPAAVLWEGRHRPLGL